MLAMELLPSLSPVTWGVTGPSAKQAGETLKVKASVSSEQMNLQEAFPLDIQIILLDLGGGRG